MKALLNRLALPLFLLIMLPEVLYCQSFKSSGIITNNANRPIPYVTISVPDKNLFFPVSDKGEFYIASSKILSTDTLWFSCVGYVSTKRVASALAGENQMISMQTKVLQLADVTVSNKKPVLIHVGSTLKSAFAVARGEPGDDFAMYMQGSPNIKGKVCSVGFFLRDGNIFSRVKGDSKAPFRVRLFKLDKINGGPGDEIINDVIITRSTKSNDWFDVDLSGYDVDNPKDGFFVCLSLLSKEYYTYKGDQIEKVGIFQNWALPYLAFAQKHVENISYHRSPYGKKWRPDEFKTQFLMRATIKPE